MPRKLALELEKLKKRYMIIRERYGYDIFSKESGSSQKFMHGIKVLMAKNYVDNLSEEVRKGLDEKLRKGILPGPAPMGYVNKRNDLCSLW